MAASRIPIKFGGLSNLLSRTGVGFSSAYDLSNVSLDRGVLEAATGYTLTIAESGNQGYGIGFGRFTTNSEFLSVIGTKAYTAAVGAAAWTQLATGVSSSLWEFEQFADVIYAVNKTDGLTRHTIGGTNWTGAEKPPAPAAPTSTELFYNSGHGYPNNSFRAYLAGAWTASGDFGSPAPTFVSASDWSALFALNKNYVRGSYHFQMQLTLSNLDLSNQDWIEFMFTGPSLGVVTNSLSLTLTTTTGTLVPISGSGIYNSGTTSTKRFYFLGQRTARSNCTKLIFDWDVNNNTTWGGATGFRIGVKVGDVWQNNSSFTVDNGPIVSTRKYAVSSYDVSLAAESDLSLPVTSNSSPTGPLGSGNPGSYTRVACSVASGGALGASDVLKVYRETAERTLGTWTYVGSALNTGSPVVDDHFHENDMAERVVYDGSISNIDPDLSPQVIGRWRASLGLGVDYDLYLSKVDKPLEYEDINSAPDPNDYSVGRSVFVDDARAFQVNMLRGGSVFFAGTAARTYALIGDLPKDLTAPRPIANLGPIGQRAHYSFKDGVSIADPNGVWLVRYNDLTNDAGSLETIELSRDIGTTYSAFPSTGTVVVVSDGDLYAIDTINWLRFDRRNTRWTKGTFSHSMVAAISDYTNALTFLTSGGGLATLGGTTYNGSAISWEYVTGDEVLPRGRVREIESTVEGTPTIKIDCWDGDTLTSKTVTLDERNVKSYECSDLIGTRFRLTFAGTSNSDRVLECSLVYEPVGGGSVK